MIVCTRDKTLRYQNTDVLVGSTSKKCDNRALARTSIFEPKWLIEQWGHKIEAVLFWSPKLLSGWESWLALSPTKRSFDDISFPFSLKLEDLAQGLLGTKSRYISRWLARKCTEKAGLFAGVLLKWFWAGRKGWRCDADAQVLLDRGRSYVR